jgi:uroporphyrin-3 C-methyltransferase
MGEPETEDAPSTPMVVADPAAQPAQKASVAAANRGGWLVGLVALVALILAGFALWRVFVLERGQGDAQSALREETNRRIAEIARTGDERKRDLDTIRARVDDSDSVNKSVREELLALGERSRHVEDAVANLAEQRLTGRDALALNEAEFLLQLAGERLELFHDAQAAQAAYRLADSALAAAEDPVFAGVRQTISAEMRALESAKPLETNATLAALDRIGANLATLPPKTVATVAPAATPSRFEALLQQFVHISSDRDAAPQSRDIELTRSLAMIDLRAAEAALLARDPTAYTTALGRARAALAGSFDSNAAAVKENLAELDRLASAPLSPAVPELGSALRELRNLRATRALAQPRARAGDGAGQ